MPSANTRIEGGTFDYCYKHTSHCDSIRAFEYLQVTSNINHMGRYPNHMTSSKTFMEIKIINNVMHSSYSDSDYAPYKSRCDSSIDIVSPNVNRTLPENKQTIRCMRSFEQITEDIFI